MEQGWFPTLQMYKPYIDEVAKAPTREEAGVIDMSQPSIRERLQRVSFVQLLKLNKPDWYLVLIGMVFSTAMGCLFPLMATFFGDVLRVCTTLYQVSIKNIFTCASYRYLAALTLKLLKMVLEKSQAPFQLWP